LWSGVAQVDVDGQVQSVNGTDIMPVAPARNDRLVIIAGENKGQTGTLLGLDGTDGIVKMESLDINIIEMSSLAKLV
jgi:transcription elongation factor SPT5